MVLTGLSEGPPLLFGVPIEPLTMDGTVARCRAMIEAGIPVHHVSLNASKTVLMQDCPRLFAIVRDAGLVSADGQSVVWAARALGVRLPERVAGIDLMGRLLALAEVEGWPVFFLGAAQPVLSTFEQVVRTRLPRLRIAGSHHGYFDDDGRVAEAIARSGARLLFVAMPSPRKEYFLADRMSSLGPVFAMGVGGSFDVWAGLIRRAPRWVQRAGLEWLYRLLQEPGRMWRRYLVGNLRFAGLVVRAALRPPRHSPGDSGPC